MKRILIFTLALLALVGWTTAPVRAAGLCCKDRSPCKPIPPTTTCPDCSSACEHWRLPALAGPEHARKLLDQLCHGISCERLKAAKKLGCCLHADICQCPDVVNGLVKALTCDNYYEVRRAAAWSLTYQRARVPQAILALYVASKLDHHYVVRDTAGMALDILTLGRRDCYRDLYLAADRLIVRLRPDYDPTNGKCVDLLADYVDGAGHITVAVSTATRPPVERIPPPKEAKDEQIPAPKEQ